MRKKILLVDDSATVLMMERMLLGRQQAYELLVAHDGSEGVEKAQAEKPDLILMDVVMPRMDGFEALRRIRADAALQATPVIMVTTRGELANVEQGYASGCTDYVMKPINGVELLTKVRQYLGT